MNNYFSKFKIIHDDNNITKFNQAFGYNNNNNEKNNEINNNEINIFNKPLYEPILPTKYTSFTQLIKDGPFYYEIEEIARQISIIDHDLLSSLSYQDFIYYLIKNEPSKKMETIFIREKQLESYILFLISMNSNLETKKFLIQNFIQLAYTLKLLGNYQTSNTIITTLNIINLTKKKIIMENY
jgi:hypothetical protein